LYDEQGRLLAEGSLQNGMRTGRWTYYDTLFKIVRESVFSKDQLNGIDKIYKQGQLFLVQGFADGVPHGVLEAYYFPIAHFKVKGTYQMGRRFSNWTEYFASGIMASDITWRANLKHGAFRINYPDGKIALQSAYLANYLNGAWQAYRPNGKLWMQGQIWDGMPEREWQSYYPNGVKEWQVSFRRGKPEGRLYRYYPNGKLMEVSLYDSGHLARIDRQLLPSGSLAGGVAGNSTLRKGTGEQFFLDTLGNKVASVQYTQGEIAGNVKLLVYDTLVLWELPYRGYGAWRHSDSAGVLLQEGFLRNELPDSVYRAYFPNGQIREQGFFRQGLREGQWETFDVQGSRLSIVHYCKGQLQGTFEEYSPQGGLLKRGAFNRHKPDSLWEWYSQSGQLSAKGSYEEGKPTGKWFYYHPDGRLASSGLYKEGLRQGVWQDFYPDGKLRAFGKYLNGQEDSTWVYLHRNGQLQQEEYWQQGRLMATGAWYSTKGRELNPGFLKEGQGQRLLYNERNRLRARGNYREGKPTGRWYFYKANGKTLEKQENYP
jgi:antitoxin component YwqK of YwqJK toxin-antitoxin module